MPFRDVPEPDKRSILTMALAEYCRENGIEPASRQYDDARELMIILYQNGHRNVVSGGGSRGYPSGTLVARGRVGRAGCRRVKFRAAIRPIKRPHTRRIERPPRSPGSLPRRANLCGAHFQVQALRLRPFRSSCFMDCTVGRTSGADCGAGMFCPKCLPSSDTVTGERARALQRAVEAAQAQLPSGRR